LANPNLALYSLFISPRRKEREERKGKREDVVVRQIIVYKLTLMKYTAEAYII
jgi:hypothetical protein